MTTARKATVTARTTTVGLAVLLGLWPQPAVPEEPLPQVPVTAADLRAQPAHNSPMLAVHPEDPSLLALANRLDAPDFGCSLAYSTDNGRNWLSGSPITTLPEGVDKCYAPEVAFDPKGRLHLLFIGLSGAGNRPVGAFIVTSDDRGRTFTLPRRVLDGERYMVRMAIHPVGGRIHLVWLQTTSEPTTGGLPPPPNPIMAAHSDDGGRSFSRAVQVSDPRFERVVAPALALGPGRQVHVLYYDLGGDVRDYQGLEGPTWEGRWSLVLSSSSDGGKTFGRGVVVDDALMPPERVMLIFTMPPPALAVDRSGQVHASWYDARNGDWDVFLRTSSDRGQSWGSLRRLNDDSTRSDAHQYLPRLSTGHGRLDVIFYDRRRDPENRLNDVYFSSSTDGGRTFSRNLRITTQSSDTAVGQRYPLPAARGLVEFGSRLALVSRSASAVAAWTDTRNATVATVQDIFATTVPVHTGRASMRMWPVVIGAGAVVVLGVANFRRRRRARAGAAADVGQISEQGIDRFSLEPEGG